jgi:hypothetical protein
LVKKTVVGLELQKGVTRGVFMGEKYCMKHRDSATKTIPKLLPEWVMFVRILASFGFWG